MLIILYVVALSSLFYFPRRRPDEFYALPWWRRARCESVVTVALVLTLPWFIGGNVSLTLGVLSWAIAVVVVCAQREIINEGILEVLLERGWFMTWAGRLTLRRLQRCHDAFEVISFWPLKDSQTKNYAPLIARVLLPIRALRAVGGCHRMSADTITCIVANRAKGPVADEDMSTYIGTYSMANHRQIPSDGYTILESLVRACAHPAVHQEMRLLVGSDWSQGVLLRALVTMGRDLCFDIPGIDTHVFAKISRNSVNSRRATTRYLLSLLAEMAKTWTWTNDDRQRLDAFLKPLLSDHSYGLAPQAFAVAAAARLNDGPQLMTDSVEFLVAS